ncbi:restriction endonuclease subunit S [Bacteroides thetaiotaomicron]|nr:restriction endonuclease subunit S [Bacteroides thetaiotaomicron]
MSGYYLLKNGEYAYNKSYSVGYDFGSIKRLDRYPMGALSTLYICFALKRHDSDFIKAYFDSLKWYREIYRISAEGARNHGLLNVPTEDFFDTKHYLPENVDEQRKIADFLIALDRRIEAQQSLVDNLKKYKRGLLSHLFSEKSTQRCTTKRYYFSEIAQRRSEKYDPSSGIEYPCVELENIEQESGKILATVPSIKQGSIKNIARPGDTLFGKLRPYLRKYAFAEQMMVCSSEIWTLIPSDVVLPKFLFYLTQTEQFLQVANISSGTKMPRAEWSNIEKAEFFIPDFSVQHKAVSLLERVDKKITYTDSVLIYLKGLKTGLMQKLFI